MLARFLFSAWGLVLLAGCCCCCGDSSGPLTPPTAESKAFDEANRMISSYNANNGIGFGNTDEAKEIAVAFAELAAEMEPDWFEGGDDSGISLSKGNFLTYCRMNDDSVVFLVHVPDFSQYEDDVRDDLINMLWICADDVLYEKVDPGTEVAIGLRGALLYGGLAIGKLEEEDPATTENSRSVNKDKLYRFFAEPKPAEVEPRVEATPDGETVDGETPEGDDPVDEVAPATDGEVPPVEEETGGTDL